VSPFAGWISKQWPPENYEPLARELASDGLALVANVAENRASELRGFEHLHLHSSSLPGLIHATRQAVAIIGVDSGPLHLAAALKKPGVAIYGPTDPAQTGPFKAPIEVLRAPESTTTYKRSHVIHPTMKAISVTQVLNALRRSLNRT
jgi:heptosyltransferase-1